jgi:prevent-host-death family protein
MAGYCITRDTVPAVANVSIRDLRNHGGEIVDRAARGELITITRHGEPVAELRPIRRRFVPTEELLRRWRHLPPYDLDQLRKELDQIIDPRL